MPRCFKIRSTSVGSVCDESIDHCENPGVIGAEDLEVARQLLSSLLYINDASGRSYLHNTFHLSWAKALLTRAKSLDEYSEQYVDFSSTGKYHYKNSDVTCDNDRSVFLQRRFLLQKDKESGYTPLHKAIMEKNLAAILLFLRHTTADEIASERLTNRPMTLLHAADASHSHSRTGSNESNKNSSNLLLAIASAKDREGMTPLRLLGRLQQPELFRCRDYIRSYRPSVDQNATMRLRTRQRPLNLSTNGNENGSDDENIDYFSENADLLQVQDERSGNEENGFDTNDVSYACEVVTFGRPQHCALGVVQGGSSLSSAFVSSSKKDSGFCPQRVQEFAQEIVGKEGSAMAVAAATHHSLVVTKEGHLYAFGLGKGGRLGLGDDQLQQCLLPRRILGHLQRRRVVGVAAAENHSLCVTSEGEVFSWGSNRFGQLGDHTTGNSSVPTCGGRSTPRRVENLKQHPCVSVAAGEKHSVALSRKGEVYVWGDNSCGQLGVPRRTGIQKIQRVETLWATSTLQGNNNSGPKITIAIAAAAQSTLVLTTGSPSSRMTNVNAIYEWGHGNHVPIRVYFESYNRTISSTNDDSQYLSSRKSSFNRTPNPTAIACARYHNVAITSDGMVYTWGLRAESLGRMNSNSVRKQQHHQRRNSSPQLVSGMLPENGGGFAVAVDASGSHTAIICNDGALFTWGTTDGNNVLGHEGVRWQPNPKRVPGVHRAVDVAVAKEHTVLLIGTSFPPIPRTDRTLSLEDLAAHKVAEYVDLFNVIPILMMAERLQSSFLIEFCNDFVRRNLDGVLNVGKKSMMNQYLNDMLAETTYRAGERYRDDHHHPLTFDVLTTGNIGRPTFDRSWLSDFETWIKGCKELFESNAVKKLLEIAAIREYEEDFSSVSERNRKDKRSLSFQNGNHECSPRTSSKSECASNSNGKEGKLDSCIKRAANMDLSTIEQVNKNASWLSKEIRGVRKKLKQINNLIHTETKKGVLSSEQEAKIARRPILETELSIYESAVEEVDKRREELHAKDRVKKIKPPSAKIDACKKEIGVQDDAKNIEDGSDSIPDQDDDKPFFCKICCVRCSDKANFILHQNGRKHRNKLAQFAEEEKQRTAASILQRQQIELMKSAPTFSSPPKKVAKNAWGTTSFQPDYKLPPPPHPVLAQVAITSTLQKSYTKSALTYAKTTSVASTSKVGTQKKKKSYPNVNTILSSSPKDFPPPTSNFKTILHDQVNGKKSLSGEIGESPKSSLWNSSPSSTRCVPLSLYSAPDTPAASKEAKIYDERSSSLSLAAFLTPPKKAPSLSSSPAPWINSATSESNTSPASNQKSLAQIQAEEESLKLKQDKSYGKGGGSWYIHRRERADSVLEIQRIAQEDREHRLLVEEQMKIEAQIREANERKQKQTLGKGPKKGKKKTKNMKRNQSNNTKSNSKTPEATRGNRSNGKKKS